MAKVKIGDVVGSWAFLVGVILALVMGIFAQVNTTVTAMILVVIGLIVGLLNVGTKEATQFLFSGLVLVLVSSAGQSLMVGIPYLPNIFAALLMIFVPATVIVALKNVFALASK